MHLLTILANLLLMPMHVPWLPLWLALLLGWGGGLAVGSPSTSPNSAVLPSVSFLDLQFGWEHSSLEKDIAAVFNKVAYGSTTPPSNGGVPNKTRGLVSTTSAPPAPAAPFTTNVPPNTPSTQYAETPEYVSRTRFKPPLPPEYTNPFADKPILRGSQSEGSAGGAGRRRPNSPPPRPPRPPPEQERIPIRPPDLLPPDRKKPLNTPARGTSRPQSVTYSQEPTSRTDTRNETADFDFVPILQNPTVTRILSGSSGRKEEERRNSSSRVLLDHVNKDSMIDVHRRLPPPPPPVKEVEVEEEEEEEEEVQEVEMEKSFPNEDPPPEVTELPMPQSEWDIRVWGVAWDIHVYLMGSLFALLTLISLINFLRPYKRLLPCGYFVALNGFLLVIGAFRSVFLLYDAYNLNHSYPAVISPLMLNIAFPCLTSVFAVLFLYLLQSAKVQLLGPRLQSPAILAAALSSHVLLCLGLYIAAGCLQHSNKFLLLVCQALVLVWGGTLAIAFLFVFGALSRAALRQQGDFLRAPFTKLANLPPRPLLGLAVRASLATAMLMLLLAAVQLYGLFGVYGINGNELPRPWPWWGFQFSVRVIEVSMCFLMVFVATLRHSEKNTPSVFTLFSCSNCETQDENKTTDDLYPAICSTNQAIHNYSVHTGKKVYDDSFPLSNITMGEQMIPIPTRMSLKKTGTMLSSRSEGPQVCPQSQRPSSMLFAEDGFVRFRTSADPEQPMEEVLHKSVTRKGTHEAVTAFNVPTEVRIEQTKVRYRPGSLEDLKYDMRMYAPEPLHHRPGESLGGRQWSAMGGHSPSAEMWCLATSPLHTSLSPARSDNSDSDLPSNYDEDQDSPLPSSSQDITPDSAVVADIYSKNGEGPVENSRYWCETDPTYGLDILSRSLLHRLKGSNFSLNHLQGYTPLGGVQHSTSSELKKVYDEAGYYLNACKIEALYNVRPEDESAV